MIYYVSWTVGILIALWIVYMILRYVFPLNEPKAISSSEFQATEEGRKALAETVLARKERGEPIVVACRICGGSGRIIYDTSTTGLRDTACESCGGTGVEGGLDYENIDCPTCGGRGYVGVAVAPGTVVDSTMEVGPKCSTCAGKRVIRREKRKEEEKRGAD